MKAFLHPRIWAVAALSVFSFLFFSVFSTAGLIFGVGMLAFGLVGAFILAKVPGNRIGWVFAVIGILGPFSSFQQVALGWLESGVNPDVVAILQIIATAGWSVFFLCLLVLIPLWYPSGRAINRYVGAAAVVATIGWIMVVLGEIGGATVGILVDDSLPGDDAWLQIANPIASWPVPDSSLFELGWLLLGLSIPVAVTSMVVRRVKSRGVERLQMKWLLFSEGLVVGYVAVVATFEVQLETVSPGVQLALNLPLGVLVLAVPISVGIAITKHRLYNIDIVISKTVTYAALAAFITGIYALVVVGIGSLVGAGDEQNLLLSIVAVAIVAVAFEPLRNRIQRWANRLVFGERATPYEVLARTTAQLAGTGGTEDVLEQVTQLVVGGTGATDAVLWLKVGGRLQPRAATPSAALEELSEMPMPKDDLPDLEGDASAPVRHSGEVLGALSISMPRGETVTGIDDKMLNDVAAGTGLLLRNIGLNAELTERAEQLRASRRRLVAAHDAERHRLERDLHDGAQQQVVAVKVKLGLARTLSEREGADDVTAIVAALADTTQDAVDAMRAVAHGIYPPLLEAEGLGVALATLGRSFSIPIELVTDGLERYPRSFEETIYFCLYEIVTRAVDAGATFVAISLVGEPDVVTFTACHDGSSEDPVSVEDRVEAFGGELSLDVEAGEVVVSGQLPITDVVAVTV